MITLAKFGPAFGVSDLSPFVMKAELLLKMAGLEYKTDDSMGAFRKAPKSKLPYIVDDGVVIPDSTFIRFHLEKKYGVDFDAGLSAEQRAQSWALEKMVEDHLYFAMLYGRWVEDANFAVVKAALLRKMPPVFGPLIAAQARRGVRASLQGHGLGRHKPEEIYDLARRDLEAVAVLLGDKPFLYGNEPKAVDATLGGFMLALFCDGFGGQPLETARTHPNLGAYADRIRKRFYGKEQALAA